MRTWLVAMLVIVLGGCTLPGARGWECDKDRDCNSGLACRSMRGDKGWTSICAGPNETSYVGSKGNWIRLMIWPSVGFAAGAALLSRVVAARKRARGESDLVGPRRRRRR